MTDQAFFEILSLDSPEQLQQLFESTDLDFSLAIMLCRRGDFSICIRGTIHHVASNSMLFIHRDSLGNFSNFNYDKIAVDVVLASTRFLNSLNFDINVISQINFIPQRPPIIELTPASCDIIEHYFNLLKLNLKENTQPIYTNSISRNLFAALIYQMIQLDADNRTLSAPAENTTGRISRRHTYVRTFLHLLHENHTKHRNVAFYAEKMFMSSKYLSTIVKETTGRSAAEWIDHMVISEAKNLLRYSGLNIQQVAYQLNFANQSSFGKYFKHFTGLSPTEYQKS